MPFGLANDPWTFPRMMGAVLRGLTWQTCLVYLDDVIIFRKGDVTQHVVELATVLERLARAGLSLKAKKCTFAAERLEYLGHELGDDGVRPMKSLIKSVKKFPVPQDADAVKRFVHMAGYYRRFVPEFASRAAPMTNLLRKVVEWRWGESQQSAFEELKKALTERPLLAYPDFTRPFRLVTNASAVGLGAALMQDQLECAADIWTVKLFRPYLYGQDPTVHGPFGTQVADDVHDVECEVAQVGIAVTGIRLRSEVSARSRQRGRQRTVAGTGERSDRDGTERRGHSSEPRREEVQRSQGDLQRDAAGGAQRENASETAGNADQLTDAVVRREQRRDKAVQKLRRKGKFGARTNVEVNGVVYIEEVDGEKRVVLPTALWAIALRESHDSVYACHVRVPQTLAIIAVSYWWPDMGVHVPRLVQSCRDCGSRKAKVKEVIPPLRSQGVGEPGDIWAIDVAGPLPVTPEDNRYVVAAVDYATRYAVEEALIIKASVGFGVKSTLFIFGTEAAAIRLLVNHSNPSQYLIG
ncbi:unnamed protein product [Phytophthora fragariaefolia]|uniref:Unnamed protein product n=1 Tax=Phytophthora fragariaefolia TaxID=1490495 RepID=A0A9W6Y805_9STRA|nr:unnamed protein product [Phytophthora fragariaefolia]